MRNIMSLLGHAIFVALLGLTSHISRAVLRKSSVTPERFAGLKELRRRFVELDFQEIGILIAL